MTEPVDWQSADMAEALQQQLAEGEDNERRRAELGGRVADIPGPLGDLLRTIAEMHAEWRDYDEMRAATEAESIRVERVTDAAVAFETWLRGEG